MGDEPTADYAGARGVPDGSRRERGAAEPLTVEQLLARPGSTTGGRRAARRQGGQPSAPFAPPPGVRNGLPPVPPGSTTPPPPSQAGLPPVPGAARPGLPPVPGAPADWRPDARPSRRSGPIPPLPGTVPPPVRTGSTRVRPPRPARRELSPGRRRLLRAGVALAAVAGVVLLYHLGLYFYVDQKIGRVDALATDGPEILAAQLQETSETYLVVGTDVPGQEGPASVATLLASVSDDGERAALVGFPPSALVDSPECRSADGDLRAPTTEAFARSLLDGGPSCMVRAVQQLSGVQVDHYLEVDLARLPDMVDALGGVPMCVVPSRATAAAADPPPAGASELSGEAATGYLRPGGEGSDATGTAVAERTQRLLTSTLRAAMSRDTLLDPSALARFLSRAADALTVDEQTTLGDLRALATSLGSVSGDAVVRTALPVAQVGHVPAGGEEAFVLLDGAGTRTLFDAVIDGSRVPDGFATESDAAPEEPGETPPAEAAVAPDPGTELVAPGGVVVDVLNGTGTRGLAATVADELRGVGFGVGAVGNAEGTVSQSVVRHGPAMVAQARTVAAAVPGAVLQGSDAIGETVQLVIGPGYESVVPVPPPAPAPAPEPEAEADTAAALSEAAAVRC
ncbi:LytR family transcriptional regulator [Blastococcus sp. TF02-09]|uniref:LCP family protein n=1 Tax=Blastococcus sp. TF02-09 TaxID=2250576 RepID=UPI000DE8395D|nr:LCP family protein [Blastococcus sp. TF02-9]RBY80330.1 LytR family transcriptional regulator [Blastococcus sp. TF02-9]